MSVEKGEATSPIELDVEEKLRDELEKLKDLTSFGYELKVEWCHTDESNLSGKVENHVIYIFEEDYDRALSTLRHEFFDYLVSLAIKPYEKAASYYRVMVNSLIRKLGEEAYIEKEQVVEAFKRIVESSSF